MPPLNVLNNRPTSAKKREGGGVSGVGGEVVDAALREHADALRELLRVSSDATIASSNGPGGEVRFGTHDRMLYSTDASLYQVQPLGVVVPASLADAERVVRFCASRKLPMLPRGGGTSLAGQCTNRAVVLDLSGSCRGVRDLHLEDRTVYAEAGVGIDELNEHLARAGCGLFFAPDPATTRQCAIGGAIGNNAAGARSVLYGRTSENLVSIDAVLSTGERVCFGPDAGRRSLTANRLAAGVIDIVSANAPLIRQRFPKTIRRNAGYSLDMILDQIERGATPETLDLSKLLCGSEGTLAMTLGATLALKPAPKAKALAIVAFPNVEEAITAVQPILRTGPSAVELLDDVVLEAARGNTECRRYLELVPKLKGRDADALHYVEYFAFGEGSEAKAELASKFDALRNVIGDAPMAAYTDGPSMAKLWNLRKAGEPLLHGLGGNRKPITFVEDNAVPVERLGEFVRRFKEIVGRHGTKAAYWAHASVGVLHVRPMIDLNDPQDRRRMRDIAVEVADLARECGGIMSGEHGDGRVRGPLLERFFGPELMEAFRQVKRLFDPENLLNPGNIVAPGPIESITQNLRIDAESSVSDSAQVRSRPLADEVDTYFSYADSHGFAHAAEQCNGAGVCRKRGGVMCPSYQATLDERHSTRGRGNALRLSITGQFPPDSGARTGEPNWTDAETIRTLDLCLSCKACKSECPSNVDIARLKAEYTAQRYRQQGRVPLSAIATGYVRVLNRVGSFTPGLANWVNSTPPARAFINRVMNVHPKRSLPKFSRSLISRTRRGLNAGLASEAPRVALFTDCFTTYNESHIGLAAIRVLNALGYNVDLPDAGCCGRSMISVGMLPQAIDTIDSTIERMRPLIEDDRVLAILVVEPSCLSAIKDDWLALKCRSSQALRERLAAKAKLVEEFVDAAWEAHPNRPPASMSAIPADAAVLLHGHCHQKALWGVETSARLLRRLVGDRLKVLDTGCCGMAGSFGYTRERFDLSRDIAELSLLPAVRNAPPGSIVVAPGTSCRHQLHDFANVRTLHPIELAELCLSTSDRANVP